MRRGVAAARVLDACATLFYHPKQKNNSMEAAAVCFSLGSYLTYSTEMLSTYRGELSQKLKQIETYFHL
jgi:hypothetical protein